MVFLRGGAADRPAPPGHHRMLLADEFGKWHGHGISLYQSSFPIHSQYKFPHAGQYTFSFRQGMRDDALKGIQEIGFSVRPAK